jgi:RNA polymerase sigma-70 factor (ECF subfamily)
MAREVMNIPEQPRSELELSGVLDNELARLARDGSACAVRMIVQRHDQRLYRIARAIVRDSTEAEDVMQDAYLSAFGSLDKFRSDATLSTWLTRIVVNKAINHLKRGSMMVSLNTAENLERLEAELVDVPYLASELDPESATARSQLRDLLQRAIDKLPEPFRIVLVMRMIEQISGKKTASSLGISEITVRTRLHRAKKLMRDQLRITLAYGFRATKTKGPTRILAE